MNRNRGMSMKKLELTHIIVVAAALWLATSAPAFAAGPAPFEAEGWLNGPDGLVAGITAAERDGKILVVYFYTDWCGYCRQFEKNILGTSTFDTFVKGATAVRINPDKGKRERELAQFYGVRGYPSFFVYSSRSKRLIATDRYDVVDGKPVMLSPASFITKIERTSAR